MKSDIKIKESRLCLSLESIIASMDMEQKREVLAWLATDGEVIESVVSHLTGNDDLGWSTGDANMRQKMLAAVEKSQLESPRYNWSPWDEIRQKVKDIRSTEHIYWVLYHQIDKDVSNRVFEELHRLGVKDNYTTQIADDEVEQIKQHIADTFKQMQAATL